MRFMVFVVIFCEDTKKFSYRKQQKAVVNNTIVNIYRIHIKDLHITNRFINFVYPLI